MSKHTSTRVLNLMLQNLFNKFANKVDRAEHQEPKSCSIYHSEGKTVYIKDSKAYLRLV